MRRTRYRVALLAFLALIGFLLQPIICAWSDFEASTAANASASGGSSRQLLPRVAAPAAMSAAATGGQIDNADCCSGVRASDNTKPPLSDLVPVQFDCFLPLAPPSGNLLDHTVGYAVRTAWYQPPNPISPYCARSARLLL